MAVSRELDEAVRLVEQVDQSMLLRFPPGTLVRDAWERLKANLHAWQEQIEIGDPFVALLRARELEYEFRNIVALFEEAGFDFDEHMAR